MIFLNNNRCILNRNKFHQTQKKKKNHLEHKDK